MAVLEEPLEPNRDSAKAYRAEDTFTFQVFGSINARARAAEQVGIDVLSLGEDRQPHEPPVILDRRQPVGHVEVDEAEIPCSQGAVRTEDGAGRRKTVGNKLYAFDGHSPFDKRQGKVVAHPRDLNFEFFGHSLPSITKTIILISSTEGFVRLHRYVPRSQ